MTKSPAILAAVATASAATAQEWKFELSNPVLSPGNPSTTVTASIDQGPGAFAFAGANFSAHATEEGWSDPVALLSLWPPGMPGQNPGVIEGASVVGISVGQLITWLDPRPGRIDVWQATFTVTDFTPRDIELSTETSRLDVYLFPWPDPSRATRTPTEGSAAIRIIPAPAGLALLSVASFGALRRRREPSEAMK